MTIELKYPVRYCHFCDQIMIYNRYTNGDHYAYCNDSAYSSCMAFMYNVCDNKIKIKEFTLAHTDILYFKVRAGKDAEDSSSHLLICNPEADPHSIKNLIKADAQIVLNKDSSLRLLERIRKSIILLD
jgi:hypothetical protein